MCVGVWSDIWNQESMPTGNFSRPRKEFRVTDPVWDLVNIVLETPILGL